MLLGFDMPDDRHGDRHRRPRRRSPSSWCLYLIAALFNWFIPDTGVDHRVPSKNPFYLIREFSHCVALLWSDRLGQISLATTTLFWGAGATLQFIVIDWAARALGLNLSQASMLQGVVAVGIAVGAVLAARVRVAARRRQRAADRRRDGRRRDGDDPRPLHAARDAADDRDRRAARASSSCR